MSAEIIQFIPKPNPNREKDLERQALQIMTEALSGQPTMIGMEPVIQIEMEEGA